MRILVVPVAWLAVAGVGFAQQEPLKVSVSASLIDAWLNRAPVPGQSNPSTPTTGIGGSAVGVSFGVDIALSRRIGINAEVSTSRYATDYQEATKYRDYVRHRDTILSGYARLHLRPESLLRVEPVAGASIVFADMLVSTSHSEWTPFWHYSAFGDYERWPYGQRRFALSGGVDVPMGRGPFAVVATFRLHYVFRDEDTRDQIGLGSWAIRPGISVRLAF